MLLKKTRHATARVWSLTADSVQGASVHRDGPPQLDQIPYLGKGLRGPEWSGPERPWDHLQLMALQWNHITVHMHAEVMLKSCWSPDFGIFWMLKLFSSPFLAHHKALPLTWDKVHIPDVQEGCHQEKGRAPNHVQSCSISSCAATSDQAQPAPATSVENGTPAPAASAWFSDFWLIQLGEWQNDQFRICMDLGFQPVAKWIYLKGSPRLTASSSFHILPIVLGHLKGIVWVDRYMTSETRRRSRQRPTSALRISCECWKQLSSQGNIFYISEDDMIKLNLYVILQMFQCQYWAFFFGYSQKMGECWKRRNQVWTSSNETKWMLGSKMLAQRSLWNLRGNVIPVQTAGLTFLNHSICRIMENLFQWWQDESGMRLLVKARRMRRSSHLSSFCQWLEARIIYIHIFIYILSYYNVVTHTHTLFSILQWLDSVYIYIYKCI